jgi:polyisoprenoid-binding protein YceI
MTRFRISPHRSRVWIDARSSLHPIKSESAGLEGFVDADVVEDAGIDPATAVTGRLAVPVERLTSGSPLYDREMRRRIDAGRYPEITGVLVELTRAAGDQYRVEGDVTFRGVTRRYDDVMTISLLDERTLCLEGRHTFDIRDFGMNPPRILMFKVEPEVGVRVRVVAEREA